MIQKYCIEKPCPECPFSRGEKAVRLGRARALQISANALSTSGRGFACHKTIDYEDEDGRPAERSASECAGSLIFSLKHDNHTQSMRLAYRLRLLTPELQAKLMKHEGEIFDSQAEMVKTAF